MTKARKPSRRSTPGMSSPVGASSENNPGSSTTTRSRKRAPSVAISKPLLYHWCRFEQEYHPYKQEHVQSLLSIFYRCNIQTEDHHHLTPAQEGYLIMPGVEDMYPVDITPQNKQFLAKHHEPFRRLAESVLLAAMKACGWDMWEAYAARLKHGSTGYYRNKTYPSWSSDDSLDVSVVSQIRIPEDVLYRTVAALFGFWGLDLPPLTPGERQAARRPIQKARKDRRAYVAAEEGEGALSDPESDEDKYMDVDTRDPRHIPKPISRGCRKDCLVYVRCLAYHYILDNLVKNVLRWQTRQNEAMRTALAVERELRLAEGCLKPPRRPRQGDSQDQEAQDSQEEWQDSDHGNQLRQFAANLITLNKVVNQYAKADSITNPHMPEATLSYKKRCASLHELSGKYDVYLQVEAQGNPELLKALQAYRKSDFYMADPQRRILEEHEIEMQEEPPMPEDVDDYLTLRDCQDVESEEKETQPLGMFLYGYDDKSTARVLAGLESDKWPGIDTEDPIYGSRKSPVPIVLRQHCSDGAVEIVARAYQHKGRAQDPTNNVKPNLETDYSCGSIVADATGMGKTGQAMQIIGLVAHLAIRYRSADSDKYASDFLPGIMLADRQALRSTMEKDLHALEDDYDPTASIHSHMSSLRNLGAGAFGTFAHTGKIAPPCLPSIIVAPPALVDHWKSEISRFAGGTLVVVHITDQRSSSAALKYVQDVQEEWNVESESMDDTPEVLAPSHLVALVSTNILSRTWKARIDHDVQSGQRPLDIFDLEYGVLIIDEVHMAKAKSQLQTACHNLSKQCSLRIGQSATPLVNSPIDICMIANALNMPQAADVANRPPFEPSSPSSKPMIPNFFQQVRYCLGSQRKLNRCSMTMAMQSFYTVSGNIDGSRPKSYISAPIDKANDMAELRNAVPTKLQIERDYERAANDVFALFGPYFMRRSKYAQTSSGKRMLPLGKLTQKTINVELREDEVEDINSYLEVVCERRKAKLGDDRGFHDQLGYYGPTYSAAKSATIAPSYFVRGLPTDLDGMEERKTPTKIQAVIDLIMLHLQWDLENEVPLWLQKKFVIHCDSREVIPAVLFELESRGLSARVFDGLTPEAERRKIESEVNRDEDHDSTQYNRLSPPSKTRILLCTPVAGLGINLWRTNIVINLTMPWSLATYEQRYGRHHRTPPNPARAPLDVTVYIILAINSVDVVMYTATALKSRLDITTFRHPKTQEIQCLLAPVKDKGARKQVQHPHRVPNLPRYRRPVELLAIDYQKNKELLTNTTQFESYSDLQIISTLRHLHLSNATLDSLVVAMAITAADSAGQRAVEEGSDEELDEELGEDLSNVVNLGLIPLEMANDEIALTSKERFKAHTAAAVAFGQQASAVVRNDVVLTKEKLDQATQSHTEWEISFSEDTTQMKKVQTNRLEDYERRIWRLIRSISLPIRDHLREHVAELEDLVSEGTRITRTCLLLDDVAEIPNQFEDCVYWIQRSLVNDTLYPDKVIQPESTERASVYIDPPTPEPPASRLPESASQSDESLSTERPSEMSTEPHTPTPTTIFGQFQTTPQSAWMRGELSLNSDDTSRINPLRSFFVPFQGPGKTRPLSTYPISSIKSDITAEEMEGTPDLTDDAGSDDDTSGADRPSAFATCLGNLRNLQLPPGVPPIDPIEIVKNRALDLRLSPVAANSPKINSKRRRSPSPEQSRSRYKAEAGNARDRPRDPLPKLTAAGLDCELESDCDVSSKLDSPLLDVEKKGTKKAQERSTAELVTWDEEMEEACRGLGAIDDLSEWLEEGDVLTERPLKGFVIGHKWGEVVNLNMTLMYLIYDQGQTPSHARWRTEDYARRYPVGDYVRAIEDDQEDRMGRPRYTLPSVRNVWTEDAYRVDVGKSRGQMGRWC